MRKIKDYKQYLLTYSVKKPNIILCFIIRFVFKLICFNKKVTFDYDYDLKKQKKKSTIYLSTHSSRNEFIYVIAGYNGLNINAVCGFNNIYKKKVFRLLLMLGVIPKFLYQPDLNCVKNMLSVIKRNGNIFLTPEGIQSMSGSIHPINPATSRFIQKANVDVVAVTSEGTYLSNPRYSNDNKKGKIKVHFRKILNENEIKSLSLDSIDKLLDEKLYYNEFKQNLINNVSFKGNENNIVGLEKIIYKCPCCNSEFTFSNNNNTMKCSTCGLEFTLDNTYKITTINGKIPFLNIDEWYKWQRAKVRDEVRNSFTTLTATGTLLTPKYDKLLKDKKNRVLITEGDISLTNEGLKINDIFFTSKLLYSLTIVRFDTLEFYYNNEYFILKPNIKKEEFTKWMIVSEEIHFLVDNKWDEKAKIAYSYDK